MEGVCEIQYKTHDRNLPVDMFIKLAEQVWPSTYDEKYTAEALKRTINTTAWCGGELIGCVRVLSDGYFFGTVSEILVLPNYQKRGIGRRLMKLAFDTSPTSLFFGARPEVAGFYEKLGYEKSMQCFSKKKPRRQADA